MARKVPFLSLVFVCSFAPKGLGNARTRVVISLPVLQQRTGLITVTILLVVLLTIAVAIQLK